MIYPGEKYGLTLWVSLLLLWIMIFAPSRLLAQPEPPLVATSFIIEATVFDDFDPVERQKLEDEIARYLADQCRRHYGFLQWKEKSAASESSVDAAFELRLIEEVGVFGASVFLLFTASIENIPVEIPRIGRVQLYQAWDDLPTHDPARLTGDIKKLLGKQFHSEAFIQPLHTDFLKSVPLVAEVHVDSAREIIILPLKWELLNVGSESVLDVSFVAEVDEDKSPGIMTLRPEGSYLIGDRWVGMVQCYVTLFHYPRVDAVSWHDAIPEILLPENIIELHVFMNSFVKQTYTGTVGRTVQEP
ncbi:MAG: hypothetical protein U9R66_01245 [Thermodesulfobacteriota bacterium]|nr:hypothetical protein [Thermodesulfobacteriota bacterium]